MAEIINIHSYRVTPTEPKTPKEIKRDKKILIEIMTNQLKRMPIEDVVLFSELMYWHLQQQNN